MTVLEGRARRDRLPRQDWAWVVPALGGSLVSPDIGPTIVSEVSVLVGVVAGAAWQVLCRRDLVDRLQWLCGLVVLAVLVGALSIGDPPRLVDGYPIGVVAGLVLAEAAWRLRDRRAVDRVAPPTPGEPAPRPSPGNARP